MSLNFIKESTTIGADKITDKTFTFFKQGFRLNGAIGEPEYRDVTVSGVDVLNLPNAKADGLNYCKLYGKCEQRNLPEGYTEVEYLQSSGTQYIATSVVGNCKVVLDAQGTQTGNTSQVVVGFHSPYGGFFGSYGDTGKWAMSPVAGNSQVDYSTRVTARIDFNSSNCTFTIDGVEGSFYVDNASGLNKNNTFDLFAIRKLQETTRSYFASARIFSCQFYQNNELVCNLIPARRNSDNELGMYDTVTGNFLTNAGTGNFIAGNDVVPTPTPTRPLNIICNNGVVKVSPNLFDKNSQYIAGFVNSDTGVLSASTEQAQQRSFVIPCLPNTTYVLQGMTANSTWGSFTSSTIGTRATSYVTGNTTLTTGSNDKYLIGLAYTASGLDYRNTLQIEAGSTPTTYMPYGQIYVDGTQETVQITGSGSFDGGTATAENLYKVNDTYIDTQNVTNGEVVRKVRVKVFDGTENWVYDSVYTRFTLQMADLYASDVARSTTAFCTHYLIDDKQTPIEDVKNDTAYIVRGPSRFMIKTTDYNTITDFKNYLAEQYANGTPVILVYPLQTATTETVTPQELTIKQGTNTVAITQASIDDLTLEVGYKAGVITTITEIENAQLDNSVTVTIGE